MLKRYKASCVLLLLLIILPNMFGCSESTTVVDNPKIRSTTIEMVPLSESSGEPVLDELGYWWKVEIFDKQSDAIFWADYYPSVDMIVVEYDELGYVVDLMYCKGLGWSATAKLRHLYRYNEEGSLSARLIGTTQDLANLSWDADYGQLWEEVEPTRTHNDDDSWVDVFRYTGPNPQICVDTYDVDGRLIEEACGPTSDVTTKTLFHYDVEGNLVNKETYRFGFTSLELCLHESFKYDAEGNETEYQWYDFHDCQDEPSSRSSYNYVEFDEYMNWIKRLETRITKEGTKEYTHNRAISYFGDPPVYWDDIHTDGQNLIDAFTF